MSLYGQARRKWLSEYIDLSAGIPPGWTIRRAFVVIKPEHIAEVAMAVVRYLAGGKIKDHIAVDGKVSCGNRSPKRGITPLHMVSAWCEELGLSLAEVATDQKSNEIKAIPLLLDLLDIRDSTITIDAMGCQVAIAERILEGGGQYVLALKGNQGKLHEHVAAYMQQEGVKPGNLAFDRFDETHGRVTRRRYFTCAAPEALKHGFRELNTLIATETITNRGSGVTAEWRYYISSHSPDNSKLPGYIRCHWGIENRLHWILDVHLGDDADRKLNKNTVQILSHLRRMVVNMVKSKPQEGRKLSIRSRLKKLSWDSDYLLGILLQ